LSFFHRHRGLTPYLLLAPGLAWLAVFFLVPLGFLGYQSLQTGTFDVGYAFDWAWGNYWDALSRYHAWLFRSLAYAGRATLLAPSRSCWSVASFAKRTIHAAVAHFGFSAYFPASSGGRWRRVLVMESLLEYWMEP